MDFGLLMDPGVNAALQGLSPPVTNFFTRGEFLDSTPWYLLLVSLLTLGMHPRYGVRLATLFGLDCGLNEAVKLACHMPRPYWVSVAVKGFSSHSSFGFPSGAAQFGAAMYGYIAIVVRRWWAVLICGILLVITCLVRLFSGIHFLLDILGGLFLGFLLLVVFLLVAPKAGEFAARLPRPARLALFVAVAAIPILLVIPAYLSLGGWQVPEAWSVLARQQTGSAINPVRIQFAWGGAGIILGSLFGYEYLRSRGGWNPPVDRLRRAGVVVIGSIAVFLVYLALPVLWMLLGITALFPPLAPFLNMTLVTLWLMAGIPTIAGKLGYT